MQPIPNGHRSAPGGQSSGLLTRIVELCGSFAVNVVHRFHEHADARLAEELTVLAQRRRLLERGRGRSHGRGRSVRTLETQES